MANIVDSYSETNQDSANSYNSGSGSNTLGQSFAGDGEDLDSAKFYLKKQSSATGSVSISIYAHSGTYGSGIPTGSALATSDSLDVSTLTTSYQLITFSFTGANRINLVNGTHYFAVFNLNITSASPNDFIVGTDNSSPTHSGNYAFFQSGSWSAGTKDICFYIYGTTSISPSSSLSPSSSISSSPSSSISPSPSPSAQPPKIPIVRVSKPGVNAITNSDPEKMIFDSQYGTLKYYTKQSIHLSFDASTGDISASGFYTHNLGYYPYCEVLVSVDGGNYEYCPFFGSGATVAYSANYKITTDKITVYGEINGVSSATWTFDFLIFVYRNNLTL